MAGEKSAAVLKGEKELRERCEVVHGGDASCEVWL
jgi:hypothetical protein